MNGLDPDIVVTYTSLKELSHWIWNNTVELQGESGYIQDQLRRSIDSVCANLIEGLGRGRQYPSSQLQFITYSVGSMYETEFWFECVIKRQLVSNVEEFLRKQKILSLLTEQLVTLELDTRKLVEEESLTKKKRKR